MKTAVLQFFSWPGRRGDLTQVYDRAIERVRIMDQNGYDAVWIASIALAVLAAALHMPIDERSPDEMRTASGQPSLAGETP